jgi:hypothetical protein
MAGLYAYGRAWVAVRLQRWACNPPNFEKLGDLTSGFKLLRCNSAKIGEYEG